MSEWNKDVSEPVISQNERYGRYKYQCIHCREKFKTYSGARTHMSKHPEIPVKERSNRSGSREWKKHFNKLC